ncbi:hypothetical protein OH805_08840 [Streptomyces sp. NBC_00879]|uniref:hypothetical protein n=1 Tax=Streptomyces sp. NBC_00879 TaxID=2975855 RepID=UPI00386EB51B|nr:hypothetical protein OH805_08840 [Streptomyces sp. NBC_00879]
MTEPVPITDDCTCYDCRPSCIFCGAEGTVEDPLLMEAMLTGGRDIHGRTRAELACVPCARWAEAFGWDAAWDAGGRR